MQRLLRLGFVAAVSAFIIASAVPADAQHRQKSGSSVSSGARAAPRSAQGGGPSAGPRAPQGSGQSAGSRPAQGPRPPQGAGPAARPRPAGTPATGRAVPRPAYRPGSGGYYPGYGYRGHYPYYGYRGYYPYYGYRGYYPWYGYYGGYYPSFYFGVGSWGWPYYYGAWPYAAYGYYGSSFDDGYGAGSGGSSLKVDVKPKSAEVYVDGHFAGIVDQFDGMFDSLPVEAGEHEITIYQEGFRSIRQRLYLSPGSTYRIKGTLEPLAPGEANEPRPQAAAQQAWTEPQVQMAPQSRAPEPQQTGAQPQGPPPDRQAPVSNPPLTTNSRFGQVAIRVQPADAEVLINGEPWRNPDGAERLLVYLSPGTHRIEIRKEGFDSFVTAVEIRRGEVTPLNVSLARF